MFIKPLWQMWPITKFSAKSFDREPGWAGTKRNTAMTQGHLKDGDILVKHLFVDKVVIVICSTTFHRVAEF
jgi:hypothetical protein